MNGFNMLLYQISQFCYTTYANSVIPFILFWKNKLQNT